MAASPKQKQLPPPAAVLKLLVFCPKKNWPPSRSNPHSGVILYPIYLSIYNIPFLRIAKFIAFLLYGVWFLVIKMVTGKTGISSFEKPCEAASCCSRGVREKTSSYSSTVHACPCQIASHCPSSPAPHALIICWFILQQCVLFSRYTCDSNPDFWHKHNLPRNAFTTIV